MSLWPEILILLVPLAVFYTVVALFLHREDRQAVAETPWHEGEWG